MASLCWSSLASFPLNKLKRSASFSLVLRNPSELRSVRRPNLQPINCSAEPTNSDEALPEDYVLVSTDPSELEKEVQRIKLENQRLRERIEREAADALLAAESKKTEINVNRLRIDAQAPVNYNTVGISTTFAPPSVEESPVASRVLGSFF